MTNIEPLIAAKKHISKTEKEELHGNLNTAYLEAEFAIAALQLWQREIMNERKEP
jgi:hypothetical protein